MLQKAKTKNLVFDENGKLQPYDFRQMVKESAKSVMSGKFQGKNLVRDLTSAAEMFDKQMKSEMKTKKKENKKEEKRIIFEIIATNHFLGHPAK